MRKILFSAALPLIVAGCAVKGASLAPATPTQAGAVPKSAAAAADVKVHEFRLENGLKVLVKEDHRAPVAVSQVWYKVGSSYEHGGITGVSHVLEHMMFKGTTKYPAGEFSRIIAENGGRENAFTGRDYTAYFQTLEKSRLPISFELEADRMRGAVMQAKEFAKEVEVVMEERRMRTEDDPQALTYEQFNAAAYVSSPYHWPIIGWMSDLKNMTADDIQQWYRAWYAPNNATLVVVGDVNPDEIFRMAQKYFGPVKPGEVPKLKPRQEVEQKGIRRITVKAPAQVPYVMMGYKVPAVGQDAQPWEPYALEVLAGILDGGASARISKNLIRGSQVAASAGVGYDAYTPHQELFMFDGTPAQGENTVSLEAALRNEIDRLKNERVTERELARVKAQVVAGKVYEKDSIFNQAMQIGMLETTGFGWQLGEELVERIRAVTPEQIQAVAKKYFTDDRLTVAVLEPLPIKAPRQPAAPQGGDQHVR